MKKKLCVAMGLLLVTSLCFSHYTYPNSLEELPFLATETDKKIYDFVNKLTFDIYKKYVLSFDREIIDNCEYDGEKNY
jgi:hypothetical protein